MIESFLMVLRSSITMQSLGKIVQRAPAVGAKKWCLSLCFFYRQDAAKRQTAGIKFTHRPKIFSPRMDDSLHRFMSNLAWPTDTWVRLVGQNFTSIGAGGWKCGPKISKISTFW